MKTFLRNPRLGRFELLTRITWQPSLAIFKIATVAMEILQLQNENDDDLLTARQNSVIFHENSPKNRWKLINQKIGIVRQMLAQLPWKHRKVLFSVFFSHLMLSIFMIHIPFMTSMLYISV